MSFAGEYVLNVHLALNFGFKNCIDSFSQVTEKSLCTIWAYNCIHIFGHTGSAFAFHLISQSSPDFSMFPQISATLLKKSHQVAQFQGFLYWRKFKRDCISEWVVQWLQPWGPSEFFRGIHLKLQVCSCSYCQFALLLS